MVAPGMDRIIKRFDVKKVDDLKLSKYWGVAYQADMSGVVEYGEDYFAKYMGYEGTEIAKRINEARINLVEKWCPGVQLLDVGIGSGEFIKLRKNAKGFDINKTALAWLHERKLYSDKWIDFKAFTFWDILEHCQIPENYLKRIKQGAHIFVSLPIFADLEAVRDSKHYRPNEHYYYFTEQGFIGYMAKYGFALLESNNMEVDAGREDIGSFVFIKSGPDYNRNIAEYKTLHSEMYYGSSAGLYRGVLAPLIIKQNPGRILDYGCGRSDFLSHFWNDGKRILERYDPAIPEFKDCPLGPFDLVLCLDLLEHIAMADVDRVLTAIADKTDTAIFSISLIPARQILPDGRNAHITLMSRTEWIKWLEDFFPRVDEIKGSYENILLVRCCGGYVEEL